jgi:uncharacterized protein YvpB
MLDIKNNKKHQAALAALFLVLAVILAYKNIPALRYEVRRLELALYREEVASDALLAAAYHRQEHSLSCEVAALKMALSVYDINVPERELIEKLRFDPTRRTKTVWGDPHTGFVGDIDGTMMRDGYGVYWDPIADVANEYTEAKVEKFDAQMLAREIADGHPVIMWGYVGAGRRVSWATPAGRPISAVNGEHTRTVVGFTGSEESPTSFVLLDPIYGRLTWSTSRLMKNWEAFDHMGVVVYPPDVDEE